MMYPITLRSKNQITLPTDLKEKLGVEVGETFFVQEKNGELILITTEGIVERTVGASAKYVKNQQPLTIEEMNQAVEDAVIEKWKALEADTDER